MDEALVEDIRSAINGNYALGNERFREQIEATLGCRATCDAAGRPPKSAETDD